MATAKKEASFQLSIDSFLAMTSAATLKSVARVLRVQDNDRKDADDIAANYLDYVANCVRVLLLPNPTLPKFPNIPFEPPADLSPEGQRQAKVDYLKGIYSDKRKGAAGLWVEFACETLEASGQMLADLDANQTGVDDRFARVLTFGSEVLRAVMNGGELPTPPAVLLRGSK